MQNKIFLSLFLSPFQPKRVAAMSDASHSSQASVEIENGSYREEQDMGRRGYGLVLPEDGYEWKKYGQKFIKNIGKVRSYFKCQRSNCTAKKRADWSTSEPGSLRVVYDGVHTHALPTSESESAGSSRLGTSSSSPNQYNLLTQVLGDRSTSGRHQDK